MQVGMLLAQGKAKLAERPEDSLDANGRADYVGWRAGDRALLLAGAAYATVASALAHAGRALPVQPRTLWSRLRERGVLLETDGDHLDPKKLVGGQRRRVLVIPLSALGLADEGDDGGPAPDSPGQKGQPGQEPGQQNAGGSGGLGGTAPEAPVGSDESYAYGTPSPSPGDGGGEGGSAGALSPPAGPGQPGPRGGMEATGTGGVAPPGTITLGERQPVLITRAENLPVVAEKIARAGSVGLDIETFALVPPRDKKDKPGLDPFRARPRLIQLGLPDGEVFVVDLFHGRRGGSQGWWNAGEGGRDSK